MPFYFTKVYPGMPLREAVALATRAIVVDADAVYYRHTFQDILSALLQRSPLVENSDLGCAYVSLAGMQKLYGGDARLAVALGSAIPTAFGARIGIGGNKFIAYLAAHLAKPGSACKAPQDHQSFAQLFSVDYLPVDLSTRQRLQLLGLETLRDVSQIGVGPLQAQFGPTGRTIWELSNGLDSSPLIPVKEEEEVIESLSFPYAVSSLDVLLFGIETLLWRAFRRSEMRGRFVSKVHLECFPANGPIWSRNFLFREGLGSAKRVLFSIKSRMGLDTPKGVFEGLSLTISHFTGEPSLQSSLLGEVKDHDRHVVVDVDRRLRGQAKGALYRMVEVDPNHPLPEMRVMQVPVDPLSAKQIKPTKMPVLIKVSGDGRMPYAPTVRVGDGFEPLP